MPDDDIVVPATNDFSKTFALLCEQMFALHGAEQFHMNLKSQEVLVWVTPQSPHRRIRIVADESFPHCECIEVHLKRSRWFKQTEDGKLIAFAVRPELALDWLKGLRPAGLQYLPSFDSDGYQLAALDAIEAASIYRDEMVYRSNPDAEDEDLDDDELCAEESETVTIEEADELPAAIEEVASTAASRIVQISAVSNMSLLDDDAKSPPGAEVFGEFLALYLHFSDRITFSMLGAQRRHIFINALWAKTSVFTAYLFTQVPEGQRAGVISEILELSKERTVQYAKYESFLPEEFGPTWRDTTVFGAFIKTLPDPWRTDHLSNMFRYPILRDSIVTSLEILDLSGLLDET